MSNKGCTVSGLCYTLRSMQKWFVSGIIGALSLVLAASPWAAVVATAPAANGSAGQGLEISPPVIELNADPGQTVTTQIRVRNVTAGELIAKGKADDFGAGTDESGQPKLLLDETGATRYSLKYWVSGVPDLDLAPQELKTATVKITVPRNAEPGGHFGVVRFTAVPPNLQGTGVALSASVGTLILLRVSGAITDKLSLAEFSATQSGKPHGFFEHGPVGFLVRVKNDGSVHEKAQGSVTVANMFGHKVGVVAVNPKGGNVLPDSVRRFEQTLDKKQLFGRYTATLALTYSGHKTVGGKLAFWVIPWKLILLVVIGLAVAFFLLRLGLRRYNAHIIAQSRGR
jgi:hypothetical protein